MDVASRPVVTVSFCHSAEFLYVWPGRPDKDLTYSCAAEGAKAR